MSAATFMPPSAMTPPFAGDAYGPDAKIMQGVDGLNWRLAD